MGYQFPPFDLTDLFSISPVQHLLKQSTLKTCNTIPCWLALDIIHWITMVITITITRARWKQEGAFEGGDGRLGGEGAKSRGRRQQVGYLWILNFEFRFVDFLYLNLYTWQIFRILPPPNAPQHWLLPPGSLKYCDIVTSWQCSLKHCDIVSL